MTIGQGLAKQLEHESKSMRQHLERVPANLDYKPHEKSMTMGHLASHLVEIYRWVDSTIDQDVLTIDENFESWEGHSPAEILSTFDERVKPAIAKIAATPDDKMMVTWRMMMGDKEFVAMPRVAVLRGFIISHLIHHRAQLGVYLRMNNVDVPATYGPSADEGNMGG